MSAVLRTQPGAAPAPGPLAQVRASREQARSAEMRMMTAAVEWAAMHPVVRMEEAATVPGTEGEVAIAGEGAPLVAEFAVVELATALGRSADSARMWLGSVMEACYRLPQTWARLAAGEVESWRVLQIARQTQSLDPDAAAWVDGQVAAAAHKMGPATLRRVIEEAIERFDPDLAYENAIASAEKRHASVYRDQVLDGCVSVAAVLDEADAHDLEAAIAKVAHELLGATRGPVSPDVRRAQALGELARRELSAEPDRMRTGRRDSTLYVHIDADALDQAPGEPSLAKVEHGSTTYTITLDRLRSWLSVAGSRVSIRPVINLPGTASINGYEATDRLREHITLQRPRCAFPFCTRPARRADLDHIDPYDPGGPPGQTNSHNLAPLCRLHHRAKTHGGWTYTQLTPGEYLWHSPHRHSFHVDHDGTIEL